MKDLGQFQTATAPRNTMMNNLFVSRGTNMSKIDLALGVWDQVKVGGQLDAKKNALYNLWKQCNKWITKKLGKKNATSLYLRRKAEVSLLCYEALQELSQLDPRVTDLLRRFQSNKVNRGVGGGVPGANLLGMSQGYGHERTSYLQSGKTQHPLAGGAVHESHDTLTNLNERGNLSKDQLRSVKLAEKKGFEQLSFSDYQKLGQLFPGGNNQTAYLNKLERLKYMAVIEDDGLLYMIDDTPLNMTYQSFGGLYQNDPYAMDKYGHTFTKSEKAIGGVNFFNHSSFNAGNDVICAGTWHILAGKLNSIDNNSGHYKPNRENLHNCVRALDTQGVDLTDTRVLVIEYAQGNPVFSKYKAATFIANRNAVPDWTAIDDARLHLP